MTTDKAHTGLRKGFSTGASAAIAAKGAVMQLLGLECRPPITIRLPVGRFLSVSPIRWTKEDERGVCVVIKDGGDDPDVTHLAEIGASAWWEPLQAIKGEGFYEELGQGLLMNLRGGMGVGTVTKPGLPVAIGLPAINPVPRRMICEAVSSVLTALQSKTAVYSEAAQLVVEIFVPKGAELAKETLNPRLGILGGISILGTTGIVKPFSHGAYRATIASALKVAKACGVRHVVLCTGTTSEAFAQKHYGLQEEAFVQMADYVKFSLEFAAHLGFERISTVCFIGKALKMAQGMGQTHASQGAVDMEFLAKLAHEITGNGSPVCVPRTGSLAKKLRHANTARHALEILRRSTSCSDVINEIGRRMTASLKAWLPSDIKVVLETLILDFDGQILFQGL